MSSSGSPMRPIGLLSSAAAASSGLAPITRLNAALLAPGQIALTTTPVGAHSRAAVRVRVRSASLVALYSSEPMWALTPLRLHMLTTRPQPCAFMCAKAACIAHSGPRKPMARARSTASSVLSSTREMVPALQALLTRTSTLPYVVAAASTIARTWALSETSVRTNSPPTSSATARPVSSDSSATTTRAPSAA